MEFSEPKNSTKGQWDVTVSRFFFGIQKISYKWSFLQLLYIYIMVNWCPLAILEGFIPLLILSTDLGELIMATPPNPHTSERRVLAGKAATIGREVGVNSALEPEPGGGFEFSRGGVFSGRNLNWGYESWGWGPLERNRIRTLVQIQTNSLTPRSEFVKQRFVHWFVLWVFQKDYIYIMRRHNAHLSGLLVASSMHEMIACRDDRLIDPGK